MCSGCGETIGTSVRYDEIDKDFHFSEKEKANYNYCPYCGHRFEKEKLNKSEILRGKL